MKLTTNRFGVEATQPVLISFGAVLCSGFVGIIIGFLGSDPSISTSMILGNATVLFFSTIALSHRRLYFLSIASIAAALFSFFFLVLIAASIFTYYLFRSTADDERESRPVNLEGPYREGTRAVNQKRRQVNETPMYCVFCGERLFKDEVHLATSITACPACNRSIPPRFRPVISRADHEMAFCIHCGRFLERRDIATMRCTACSGRLPAA